MYGYEDRFWNKMGWFTKWFPFGIIPLPNGGNANMRPVFVNDVATVMDIIASNDEDLGGKIIELVGPEEYLFKSLVELFQDASMSQHHGLTVPKIILKYPFFYC